MKLENDRKAFKFPDREPKYFVMNPVTYEINIKACQIRSLKATGRITKGSDWTVEIGIFKKYLKEPNENLIRKCFDNDWDLMKDVATKFKCATELDVKDKMWTIWK